MSKKYNREYFANLRKESLKTYENTPPLNWGEMVDGKYVVNNRYEFKWRFAKGHEKQLQPLDLSLYEYIRNFQKENFEAGRGVSAYVGTDSQNHLSYTRFVTVICLQVERNGVHVLASKFDIPKIYDFRYRLLKEADMSAEVVRNHKEFFKEIDMPLDVHSDYASITNHKSSGVVTEAANYLKTLGINLKIKPESWSASYAADHFC